MQQAAAGAQREVNSDTSLTPLGSSEAQKPSCFSSSGLRYSATCVPSSFSECAERREGGRWVRSVDRTKMSRRFRDEVATWRNGSGHSRGVGVRSVQRGELGLGGVLLHPSAVTARVRVRGHPSLRSGMHPPQSIRFFVQRALSVSIAISMVAMPGGVPAVPSTMCLQQRSLRVM